MNGHGARDGRAPVVGMLNKQQDLCQRRRAWRTVHRRAPGAVRACSPKHARRSTPRSPMHVHRCTFTDARPRDRVPPSATIFRRGCARLRLARHRPDGRAGSPIGTEQPDGTAGPTRISACVPARSRPAAAAAVVCGGGAAATHVASTGCCAASPGRDPPAPDAAAATSRATAATAARTGHGARTSAWGVWRKRRSPTASLFAVG